MRTPFVRLTLSGVALHNLRNRDNSGEDASGRPLLRHGIGFEALALKD